MFRRCTVVASLLLALLALPQPAQGQAAPEGTLAGVVQLAVGLDHTCARVTGGEVRCWGRNTEGQGGTGATGPNLTAPVPVVGTSGSGHLTGVASIAAGEDTTCALLTNHQVRCWGVNGNGELGNDTNAASSSRPVVVKAVAGNGALVDVTQIAGGLHHFCARLSTGQAVCWGDNQYRQLGDATTADRHRPVRVKGAGTAAVLANVKQVAAGGIHSCFLLTNGQARCVGNNSAGNLGDGTTTERQRPVAVRAVSGAGNLGGIAQLVAGDQHTCARLTTKQVRCWGANFTGNLGDNTNTQRPRPVKVKGVGGSGVLADVVQLTAAGFHTCARQADGDALCWGQNSSGQGGDTTTTNPRLAPVAVSLSSVTSIATGADHACAVTGSATWCFGNNDFADLGTGAGFGNFPTPAMVQG